MRVVVGPTDGAVLANIVGNSFLSGTNSSPNNPIRVLGNESGNFPFAGASGIFLEGNVYPPAFPLAPLDQTVLIQTQIGDGGFPAPVVSRFNYPLIATTDAFLAQNAVLSDAGAKQQLNADGSSNNCARFNRCAND